MTLSDRFQPPAHRVIIKPDLTDDEKELKKYEGLTAFEIVKVDGQDKRDKAGVNWGTVVAIGPTAWKAIDGHLPEWKPWAKLGDRVMFGRYAGMGFEDPDTSEEYFIINDDDILLVELTND